MTFYPQHKNKTKYSHEFSVFFKRYLTGEQIDYLIYDTETTG